MAAYLEYVDTRAHVCAHVGSFALLYSFVSVFVNWYKFWMSKRNFVGF